MTSQPGLDFRLRANVDGFEAEIRGASRVVTTELGKMNQSAQRFDAAFAGATRSIGGGFKAQIQQAGFQIGDFAVQVASGQNALVALTQQGSQLLGVFGGPWGAVLGAAAAVAGAVAVSLFDMGAASEEAGQAARDLEASVGDVGGAIGDVESAARAYADAIAATGGAQAGATDSIVADLGREFTARKELLALTLEQLRITAEDARARQSEIDAELMDRPNLFNTQGMGPDAAAIYDRDNQAAIEAYTARIKPLVREYRELSVQAGRAEIQIRRAEEIMAKGVGQIAEEASARAAAGRPGARRSGGGSGARAGASPLDALLDRTDERIAATERETAAVGMSAETSARAQLAYEAERLELDLLTAAREQHGAEADRLGPVIAAYVQHYRDAASALIEARAAQQRMAEAQRAATRAADEQRRAVEQIGDALTGAVQQADSFSDALKNVGLQLLNIAAQGAFGAGPLGGFFNQLFGVAAGGLFGLAGGGTAPQGGLSGGPRGFARGAAFRGGQVIPFARGGVVSGPTTFPMSGGRVGLMGEAGAEAILPLRRGPGGRLGVEAAGGGGVVLHMTVDARGSEIGAAERIEARLRRFAQVELVPAIETAQRRRQ